MKLTLTEKKGQDFLIKIYSEFWRNESFRKGLIENPEKTLNEFTGRKAQLPKDKRIIVEDQTNPNHIYLNLPVKPILEDMELSEEQLEKVTGGAQEASFWDAIYTIATNPLDALKYVMEHE